MTDTASVTLSTSAYTALTSGETFARVQVPRGKRVRMKLATTTPAAGTADYEIYEGAPEDAPPYTFSGIASGDELYAMVDSGQDAFAVRVSRTTTAGTAIASIAAGENTIGGVHGWGFDVTTVPTVTNGGYTAGDIVGGLLTFTNVSRIADEAVIVTGCQVVVKAAVTSTLTLHLFNADPTNTTKTDNAAYSLAAADAFGLVKSIPILALGGYLTDHGTPNSYSVENLGIVAKPVSTTRNLYGLLVDGTGWTLTSTSDIQVRLRGVGV